MPYNAQQIPMDQSTVDAAVLEAVKTFLSRPSTTRRAKDGLLRFLNADPPRSQVASILPMDEMEVRLERIEQVRKRAEEEQQNGEPFQFTILQLATLLVMPMDSLRDILQPTWPMPMSVYLTAGLFLSISKSEMFPLEYYMPFADMGRYSVTKGRPLLGDSIGGAPPASGASKGSTTKSIPRNATQRQKVFDSQSTQTTPLHNIPC